MVVSGMGSRRGPKRDAVRVVPVTLRSGGEQFGYERGPVFLEAVPPLRERDALIGSRSGAEILALFLEAGAAARGSGKVAEPTQRVIALFAAPAIVLDPRMVSIT